MTVFEAFLLGMIQGLTEFVPVSSSSHLLIAEELLGVRRNDLQSFHVAVHFGTFLALLIYFRKDVLGILKAGFDLLIRLFRRNLSSAKNENEKLLVSLTLALLPTLFFGFFFNDLIDQYLENFQFIPFALIGIGCWFFVAEAIFKKRQEKSASLNYKQSFLIGLAQAIALIPGVSRSGITISTGLVQGIDRKTVVRFSFLLGGLTIFAATTLSIIKVLKGDTVLPPVDILLSGMISSFVFGLLSIHFMINFLQKHSLNIFGIYRIILGILLVVFFNL